MKKILVTGAAGFLGSNLCLHLLDKGYHVVGFDNFYTGQANNIDMLKTHKNFDFVEGSINEPLTLPHKFDEIYNMACPASPPAYQRDPIYTWQTSVFGMWHVLQFAQRMGAKVLQASTSEVYGDPEIHPQPESYVGHVNPIGIRSCYDEGKRAAETLCMDWHRQHGLPIKLIRIFNTYGPQMDPNDGRVVSNFIVQALKGQDITIYGTGQQTRSFCYVSDLINGIVATMEKTSDSQIGPVNLGNPGEFTMLELAELVIKATGSTSKITYHPLPGDDPKQRRPNIERAKEWLNWEPVVPLAEGLEKTIPWFRSLV